MVKLDNNIMENYESELPGNAILRLYGIIAMTTDFEEIQRIDDKNIDVQEMIEDYHSISYYGRLIEPKNKKSTNVNDFIWYKIDGNFSILIMDIEKEKNNLKMFSK